MKQESETVPESEHLETEIPEPPKTEIELKFEVRPEHMMRLKRAPWVKAAMDGPAKVKTLNARYFDTPDLKLRRKGLYLRVRKEGRDYVQCVKARESGDAGAFARLEWESVVPRGHPDPTLVTDDKGRTLLPIKDSAELEEVFESRVRRSQRRLTPDSDSAISLDLDVGEIASGSKSEPICEAELEVISGDRRHLFDVALQLLDEVPARLVADTKADRGYALYSGGSPDWCKAEPLLLDRGVTAENALARMVMNCIDHMRRNEACVLARADDEGVHQMRVATRRLRSSLAIYKRLQPGDLQAAPAGRAAGPLIAELKWLIGELGPARDWDVFLSDVLGAVVRGHPDDPDLAALRKTAEARRDECYEAAQAAIRARRYTALLLRLGAWVEGRGWRSINRPEDSALLYGPVENLADVLLRKRHKKVLREGKGFESMAPEERHALRIQIKKLRYASEFLGSLYPRKRVTRFVGALRDLQDGLGLLNDLAVARRLMAELTVGVRGKRVAQLHFAAGLVAGWHTHLIEARDRSMVKAWNAFATQKPFWR